MTGDLSLDDIDRRVDSESFPELQRHWRLFRQRRCSLDEIDQAQVDADISKHVAPNGWISIVLSLLTGMAAAYWISSYSFWFVSQRWLLVILWVWTTINLAMLTFHCCTLTRRYWLFPMEQLIGRKLALILQHSDYRSTWNKRTAVRSTLERLQQLGINERWDDPQYIAGYEKSGQWKDVELKTARQLIHAKLIEFLGRKDAETRKFQPGRYVDSLTDRKGSVTRFVSANQTAIDSSKQGELSESDGIALLQQLLEREVAPGTIGQSRLRSWIDAAKSGRFLPTGVMVASIWKRDPWVDLTHQQEFFSSASLRGVKRVGRGTKGRLGPFLYLDDPCVSALDISDNAGRRVRARIAAAVTTDGTGSLPVLYVDGIEGTNSVDRSLVTKAIIDYATACQFSAVLFHKYPHNQVPRFFLRDLKNEVASVVTDLAYVNSDKRQYLDGFGWPIEPLEYAYPVGQVSVYAVKLDPSIQLGRPETTTDRYKASLRRATLWLILFSALGYASFTTTLANPWLLPGLFVFAALGIFTQLWVQRLGLRTVSGQR